MGRNYEIVQSRSVVNHALHRYELTIKGEVYLAFFVSISKPKITLIQKFQRLLTQLAHFRKEPKLVSVVIILRLFLNVIGLVNLTNCHGKHVVWR